MITTSIPDPHPSRPRTLALCYRHRPQRRVVATRKLLLSVALIVVFAVAPRQLRAGNLVYTWHEGDGQVVNASLTVASGAQQAGAIQFDNVLNFSFSIPSLGVSFLTSDLQDTILFPIPIDTSTAIPTEPIGPSLLANTPGAAADLILEFDEQSFSPPHFVGAWVLSSASVGGASGAGYGDWTVSSLPEPSSLLLAVMAGVCGIAFGAARKHRATRIRTNGA